LTGKLHDGELDRHSLHQQLVDAKLDYQQLSVACNDALSMATTVEKLQKEVWYMDHVILSEIMYSTATANGSYRAVQ